MRLLRRKPKPAGHDVPMIANPATGLRDFRAGALLKNARKLGLTEPEARRLATAYMAVPVQIHLDGETLARYIDDGKGFGRR